MRVARVVLLSLSCAVACDSAASLLLPSDASADAPFDGGVDATIDGATDSGLNLPCSATNPCAPSLTCASGASFPEGSCVARCNAQQPSCPSGFTCVELPKGQLDVSGSPLPSACLQRCGRPADCRDHYHCTVLETKPEGSFVPVCIDIP